jgi:hypothetical protein
VVETAAAL